jgi:hypothetical protein
LIRRFADVRPPPRIQGVKKAKMKGGKKRPIGKKQKSNWEIIFFQLGN